jgi:hypothetical protein
MQRPSSSRFAFKAAACVALSLAGSCLVLHVCQEAQAAPPWLFGGRWTGWGFIGREHHEGPQALGGTWYNFPRGAGGTAFGPADSVFLDENGAPCAGAHGIGGNWYWMRSPEQERVVIAGLFTRYCIRCHGVDGRGVWDIPGVPDFTNTRWQLSRSDDQIARIVVEGRGAVMPPFRGTLTLEEAWAMARYLRTFVPGSGTPRPELGPMPKSSPPKDLAPPPKGKK